MDEAVVRWQLPVGGRAFVPLVVDEIVCCLVVDIAEGVPLMIYDLRRCNSELMAVNSLLFVCGSGSRMVHNYPTIRCVVDVHGHESRPELVEFLVLCD